MSIAWEGIKEFGAAIEKLQAQQDAAVKEMVAKGAALVVKNSQTEFSGSHKRGTPRSGGSVGAGGTGQPQVISGFLRRSIIMQPIVREGVGIYSTSVGPTAIYSRSVELGRTEGSARYPFLEPGVKKSIPEFSAIATAAWNKYVKP